MRILVTGGAGFLGSHIVDRLIQEGHEVAVVDDLSTGKRRWVHERAVFFKTSLLSRGLERVIKRVRPDTISHLAAQMDVRRAVMDPLVDAQVNIVGTLHLLDLAVRYGVRRVLYASSGLAVYGEQDVLPTPETAAPRPCSPYGVSKLAGEHYVEVYQRLYGLAAVTLRYASIYGPRQDPFGEGGLLGTLSQKMLHGGPVVMDGNGLQTRDFVFIEDAVEAHMAALRHVQQMIGSGAPAVLNVGTGLQTSMNTVIGLLAGLTQSTVKVTYGPEKKGEPRRSALDPSRIAGLVGWEPRVMLAQGLKQTLEHLKVAA